jgi:MFS family permease
MNSRNIMLFKRVRLVIQPINSTDLAVSYYNRTALLRIYRIATSTFFFIAGFTFATWASRIPEIQGKLHLTDGGLGAMLFALPVGLMVSLPLSGWLVSRYGSKQMVILGALVYPLILLFLALSSSVLQLTIALFIFGITDNLLNIAMNTQAVGVETLYGRSVMASFHGLWSIGGFSGAIVGTFFISSGISPLIHFLVICIITGILVLAANKFTLPHDEGKRQAQPIWIKPDQKILLLGLIAFCCMVCEGAMVDWSGVYFKKIVQAPVSYITIGYVAFTGTMALGRFLGDGLVTRFGIKRILQMSGAVISTGLLIAIIFPYLVTATVGFFLVGFGVSSVVPIVYGLAGKSTTMSASTALAAVSTIGFLGFLIGPPVIGFIAQAVNLRWSFTLIALLGFGTTLLAGKLKKNNIIQ